MSETFDPMSEYPVVNEPVLDFDSDEPLPVCPLRNNGDEICEGCQ